MANLTDSKENSSETEDSYPSSLLTESWNKVSFFDAKKRHRFVIEDFRNWSRWVTASGRTVVLKGPVFTLAGRDISGFSKLYKFSLHVTVAGASGGSTNVSVSLNNLSDEALFVRCQLFIERGDLVDDLASTASSSLTALTSWNFLTKEQTLCPQKEGAAPLFGTFKRETVISNSKQYLVHGKLTIICELELKYNPIVRSYEEPYLPGFHQENRTLGQDLAEAFGDTSLSDVTLVCEGRIFSAHKIILSMRSKYFKAMFSHPGTSENQTNTVEVKQMEAKTLEKLLRFIYTDQVDQRTVDADLFVAADMFELSRLRSICEAILKSRIDEENASDLLLLAYLQGANDLKAASLEFVVRNFGSVKVSPGWKSIVEGHAKLLDEVLSNVLEKGLGR